jgi:hypothetical protein
MAKRLGVLAIGVLLMTASLTSPGAAATTVVVSADGQQQWHSRVTDDLGNPNSTFGLVTFVTGPGTPPRGTGSLRLQTNPGKGNGSAQMRSTGYGGVTLSNLTELNYWAYVTTNNGQQFPFLSLDVSCATCSGGAGPAADRLFFEPPYQQPLTGNPACPDQGATLAATWQKWNALAGCWWDNGGDLGGGGLGGVQPLSVFIGLHPDATITNPGGVGGLRLAVGFASTFNNFDGNIDMVTVGVGGQSTSYDFEPPSACRHGEGDGDFQDKDGHTHHATIHQNDCETDHGQVQDDDRDSGKHFESTSTDSATYNSNANTTTLTMIGTGLDDGLPVGFTMVAVDYGGVAPAIYTLTLTDGRTFTGTLVSGLLQLQ